MINITIPLSNPHPPHLPPPRFELVSVSEDKVPVPKKVKMGKEKAWKAEMITNLTTQLWVLRKKSSNGLK